MAGDLSSSRGEPTEDPTPERLAEARRRGEIAVSRDLIAAAATVAAFIALALQGPSLWRGAIGFVRQQLAQAVSGPVSPGVALRAAVVAGGWALAVVVGAATLGALAGGLLQTRGRIVFPSLQSPLARGWLGAPRRRRGPAAGTRALLGLAQAAVVVAVCWGTLRPMIPLVARLAGAPASRVATVLGVLAARLGGRLVLALVALAAVDYLAQWMANRHALRMTRAEVKRQRRETEGDEQTRARRRQAYREL
ncbi:MAG: type secretion protein [Myxococcales bacterium]|nr:type secretion protein [Myxococcales bacterium]